MNVKDKIMMIMVCSFFGLMFFVVGTEMYLSLKENIQPTTELWTTPVSVWPNIVHSSVVG